MSEYGVRYHMDMNILLQNNFKKLDKFYDAKIVELRKKIAELNSTIYNLEDKIDDRNLKIITLLGLGGLDTKEAREEHMREWLNQN